MNATNRQIAYIVLGVLYSAATALQAQGVLSPVVAQGAGFLAIILSACMHSFGSKDPEPLPSNVVTLVPPPVATPPANDVGVK